MALIEEISLDTLRPTQFVSIRLQQNDALDRKIDVQITEGSDIYTIPTSGAVISLRMVKPDGNPIDNTCEVINNKARFTITKQMTVISGRCSAQIKITNSSTGGILKTVKFNILIDEEVISDSMIVSTGEFTALQAALLEVGDITNKVDKSYIANNLITDIEGFVLDARQGKVLDEEINTINNNLAPVILYEDTTGLSSGEIVTSSSPYNYKMLLIRTIKAGVYHQWHPVYALNYPDGMQAQTYVLSNYLGNKIVFTTAYDHLVINSNDNALFISKIIGIK